MPSYIHPDIPRSGGVHPCTHPHGPVIPQTSKRKGLASRVHWTGFLVRPPEAVVLNEKHWKWRKSGVPGCWGMPAPYLATWRGPPFTASTLPEVSFLTMSVTWGVSLQCWADLCCFPALVLCCLLPFALAHLHVVVPEGWLSWLA